MEDLAKASDKDQTTSQIERWEEQQAEWIAREDDKVRDNDRER